MTRSENFDIQPATDNERDWAGKLLAGSEPWITLGTTLEQCRKVCWDSQYTLYIAHLNSNPAGLIILHPLGLASSPYIKSVIVAEPHRGNGIGTRLMNFVEDHLRKDSKHLFLCVSSFNSKARIFYERLGYHPVGEFKDYAVEGESELLLYKRLR